MEDANCKKYNIEGFTHISDFARDIEKRNTHFFQKNRLCTYEGIMLQMEQFESKNDQGILLIVYTTKDMDSDSVSVAFKRCYVDKDGNILRVIKTWEDENFWYKEISLFFDSTTRILTTEKTKISPPGHSDWKT